jgi:hypothetical protein
MYAASECEVLPDISPIDTKGVGIVELAWISVRRSKD